MLMLSAASFGAIRGVVPRGLPIAGAEETSPTARSNVSATVWKMDMAVEEYVAGLEIESADANQKRSNTGGK